MSKTHHGRITNWWLHYPLSCFEPPEGAPGYIVRGDLIDHPMWNERDPWMNGSGNTSWVLRHDDTTGEVETLNSRYRLVGNAIREPTDARSKEDYTPTHLTPIESPLTK